MTSYVVLKGADRNFNQSCLVFFFYLRRPDQKMQEACETVLARQNHAA